MGFGEWLWKTIIWLTKIFTTITLGITALTILILGFIPGLQFLWIFTGILALLMGGLINYWWLKLEIFSRTKQFGQNIGKGVHSLPKMISHNTESSILKSIEKNFCHIAEANGINFDDIFAKIIHESDGLKIRLKSIKAFKTVFSCPIKLIQINGMEITIDIDKNGLQKNFFQSHIGQTKLYLMSQEIANIITGILLHNWIKRILTNDAKIAQTINEIVKKYPPGQLTNVFCREENAKKIIRSQFLGQINDMIVHNGHIIHEGVCDFDPTNPIQPPQVDSEFINEIDFEIEEKKFETKDIDPDKKSDQMIDSGSLENT